MMLRFIVGFELVEKVISTNPKPTIYRNCTGTWALVYKTEYLQFLETLYLNRILIQFISR